MKPEYMSVLTKEALVYNLAYHIKEVTTEEELYKRINSVLSSFEFKKDIAE